MKENKVCNSRYRHGMDRNRSVDYQFDDHKQKRIPGHHDK